MKKMPELITADHIYTPQGWVQGHVLRVDSTGRVIEGIRPQKSQDDPTHYAGYLIPGLVNAHCHLELSHLAGKFRRGEGMVNFVKQVIQSRGAYSQEVRLVALSTIMADPTLATTVLVGDTLNTELGVGAVSPYFEVVRFVELLGANPQGATSAMSYGARLLAAYAATDDTYLTLHAPYSVSSALRDRLMQAGSKRMSIHLLESAAERAYFRGEDGGFASLYEELGIHRFEPDAQDPLTYISKGMAVDQDILFVHLLEATTEELADLVHRFPRAWFCLCPRSNVFLHQKGPDLARFLPYVDRICLGTDSLASNDSLDVWEEVKWIQQHYPTISLHQLVTWATTNGAKALGREELVDLQQVNGHLRVNWLQPDYTLVPFI